MEVKKNQNSFKLISCLICIIFTFTVSKLHGQSCEDVVININSGVQDIITGTGTSNAIYSSYSSTSNSTWATMNWTGQVDFSGVAFDNSKTATLISPRHILMAQHHQRNVGSTVVFHDSTGDIHTAILIAKQSVPGGLNPDITVGLLDVDVPVKYYKVLPPQTDWGDCLSDALVVSTHHTRNASIRRFAGTWGLGISLGGSSLVPASYYAPLVSGTSGNPSFLLINGDPILISTFTYASGNGPFFSEPSNFNMINSIMDSLGGGYQLETTNEVTLSVETNNSQTQDIVLVYPNPATTEIMLLAENIEIETVSIYGIDGSFKGKLQTENNSKINIDFLKSGVYLLKFEVLNGNYIYTKQLIKK